MHIVIVKRPLYTKCHKHALFSWEEEAVKGIVTISSLLIFINLNDKRISEAGAASDKSPEISTMQLIFLSEAENLVADLILETSLSPLPSTESI